MGRPFNPDRLRRAYLDNNMRRPLLREMIEGIRSGQITHNELSIRDCFESFNEYGPAMLKALDWRRRGGGMTMRELLEAGGGQAVNSGDFANITGQLVFTMIKKEFDYPNLLWSRLCTTVKSDFLNGERIPGIGGIGASAIQTVGEGEDFPLLGVNEEYFDAPPMNKRGFIVQITREALILDRTGELLKRCGDGGKWMSINKEFRVLSAVAGVVNSYNRNGVSSNTYATSGAYINQLTVNPLVDWTSVEAAELLFDGMTDPNTGLPIVLPVKQVVVPSALKHTANRVIHATETQHVNMTPTTATIRQTYDNPLREGFYGNKEYTVETNAFVKSVTSSPGKWFVGDYPEAVTYREAWATESITAPATTYESFHRDVVQQYRFSEMGGTFVIEPRFASSQHS